MISDVLAQYLTGTPLVRSTTQHNDEHNMPAASTAPQPHRPSTVLHQLSILHLGLVTYCSNVPLAQLPIHSDTSSFCRRSTLTFVRCFVVLCLAAVTEQSQLYQHPQSAVDRSHLPRPRRSLLVHRTGRSHCTLPHHPHTQYTIGALSSIAHRSPHSLAVSCCVPAVICWTDLRSIGLRQQEGVTVHAGSAG